MQQLEINFEKPEKKQETIVSDSGVSTNEFATENAVFLEETIERRKSKMENNNALQIFSYKGRQLRTVLVGDDVWFVAKDVCDVLEFRDAFNATRGLDEDEKGTQKVSTPGGLQDMTVISESGLYTLTLRSNKEEAKNFKRCVTHEILPSIRKHGAYITPAKMKEIMQDPDTWIQVLQILKEEQQKVRALNAKIEEDKPKVEFAEALKVSDKSVLVNHLSKILQQNGIEIGQNELFEWLRKNGYLMNSKGRRWNLPTQKSSELGLFEIKTVVVTLGNGKTTTKFTPLVTVKGQEYFIRKFLQEKRIQENV